MARPYTNFGAVFGTKKSTSEHTEETYKRMQIRCAQSAQINRRTKRQIPSLPKITFGESGDANTSNLKKDETA